MAEGESGRARQRVEANGGQEQTKPDHHHALQRRLRAESDERREGEDEDGEEFGRPEPDRDIRQRLREEGEEERSQERSDE